MGAGFGKEVRRLLEEDGWYRLEKKRGKGSHEIWAHPAKLMHLTVGRKIMSRHTANGILKNAGIGKRF